MTKPTRNTIHLHTMYLIALITLIISILFQTIAANANSNEQPNIVIYLSDDHSQYDSSLYGNANIPTPNFENLAAEGMTFTHAFVASPSCAPSRAALLTGLMPARNGARANHTFPKRGTQSLINNLQQAGYEVVAFGKVSHNPRNNRYGFDHMGKGGSAIKSLRNQIPRYLNSRKSNKPLCLFVGTSNPHVPWPKQFSINPKTVQFPPHHLDTPSTRKHRAAYYQEIIDLDQFLGELKAITQPALGDNTIFIHSSDHGSQWPFGKWNLYDYGIRVPLIISWPGKIKPASTSNAMVSWIDLLPTIIDLAGRHTPKDIDGQSFARVLLGKQNTHRTAIFTTHTGDGHMNIYPIRAIRTQHWKLIHNLHPEFAHTNHSDLLKKPFAGGYWAEWDELTNTNPRARQIVNRYYKRPEWELYNVTKDKWEQYNLINEPEHEQRIAEMKTQLTAWRKSQNDTDFVHATPRPLSKPEQWQPGKMNAPRN